MYALMLAHAQLCFAYVTAAAITATAVQHGELVSTDGSYDSSIDSMLWQLNQRSYSCDSGNTATDQVSQPAIVIHCTL
jgi:hypothetical protein